MYVLDTKVLATMDCGRKVRGIVVAYFADTQETDRAFLLGFGRTHTYGLQFATPPGCDRLCFVPLEMTSESDRVESLALG